MKRQRDERETRPNNTKGVKEKGKRHTVNKRKNVKSEGYAPKHDIDKEEKLNDPNWYFTDKALMDQATQMSFSEIVGAGNPGMADNETPTIMELDVIPSPGVAVSGSNRVTGFNMAMQRFYAQLSAITGRTSTYAPQDVGILLLALGEILSMVSHIRRAFGTVNASSYRNRAVPKALIHAMGFDYDDLVANLSNYVTEFNAIITNAQKIPFPINIAYLAKCNDMYNAVYMDEEVSTAQLYLIRPHSTWVLDETSLPTGSMLDTYPLPVGGAYQTMGAWISTLNTMVTALLTSSSLNVIYADILNMANKEKVPLFTIPYLEMGYVASPVFNEGILEQLHNAVIVYATTSAAKQSTLGITDGTPDNDVQSDPNNNSILYNPYIEITGEEWGWGKIANHPYPDAIVDFFDDNPSVERRCEASRFIVMLDHTKMKNVGTDFAAPLATASDHFILGAFVYSDDSLTPVGNIPTNNAYGTGTGSSIPPVWQLATNFKHSPVLRRRYHNGSSPYNITQNRTVGEVNFFTKITSDRLTRVNSLIAQALYSVR